MLAGDIDLSAGHINIGYIWLMSTLSLQPRSCSNTLLQILVGEDCSIMHSNRYKSQFPYVQYCNNIEMLLKNSQNEIDIHQTRHRKGSIKGIDG